MKTSHSVSFAFISFFAIALLAGSFPCLGETFTVEIDSGDYSIVPDDSGWDSIAASKFGMRQILGKPALPARISCIAIPRDAVVLDLSPETKAPLPRRRIQSRQNRV